MTDAELLQQAIEHLRAANKLLQDVAWPHKNTVIIANTRNINRMHYLLGNMSVP